MLHWALSGAHAIFWLPPNLLCSILRVVRTLAGLLSLLWAVLGHLRNVCSQRFSHWSAVLLIFVTSWWADRWISKSVVDMIDTREYSRTLAADISKMMEYFQKVIPTTFQDYPELAGVSIPSSIKNFIFWSMSLHIVPLFIYSPIIHSLLDVTIFFTFTRSAVKNKF